MWLLLVRNVHSSLLIFWTLNADPLHSSLDFFQLLGEHFRQHAGSPGKKKKKDAILSEGT